MSFLERILTICGVGGQMATYEDIQRELYALVGLVEQDTEEKKRLVDKGEDIYSALVELNLRLLYYLDQAVTVYCYHSKDALISNSEKKAGTK